MVMREDFEIYTVKRNGKVWYAFKVDYFGRYYAPTEEQILKLRTSIKRKVKAKLEWVEEENQKYYARLAEQERKRALLFRAKKEAERKAGLI